MRNVLYRPPDQRSAGGNPHHHRLARRLFVGAGVGVLVAIPFTLLLLLVESAWQPLENLDRTVADNLNQAAQGHSARVHALEVLATALDPWVFRAVVIGVAIWLWRRGATRLAIWATVTLVIGGVLAVVLKLIVARARPALPNPVAHASGYSFPSGHALNSFLCVGILILVFLPVLRPAGKAVAYTVGAALVLLTGYDRVALGVHYVSDVLAGWGAALAVIAGTAAAFEIWRREHGRPSSTAGQGVDPDAADEMGRPG